MDLLVVLLVLSNLSLLGSSRLLTCIQTVAAQGVIIGLLPLFAGSDWHESLALSVAIIALKGVAFPRLLVRALRDAEIRREVEPFIGYSVSVLFGLFSLGAAFWLTRHMKELQAEVPGLLLPAAISTMLVGVFLIVARRKALTQVLGFIVMENGIYAVGLGLVGKISFMVEMGILLDVFVGVFVMGIVMYHINREFDHIDTDQLSSLKG